MVFLFSFFFFLIRFFFVVVSLYAYVHHMCTRAHREGQKKMLELRN